MWWEWESAEGGSGVRVLIACEESQAVCIEFRKRGHEAFSCDLQECSGGHPEWHFQEDVFKVIAIGDWDMMIAFPPCTHLAVSGAKWFEEKRKDGRQHEGIDFFMQLTKTKIEKWAIENPVGIMSSIYRKPNQIIQPWMYGHGETKATCLWLRKLPRLNGFNVVEGREGRVWKMSPGINRAKERSKTYEGIASAMANQWG